MRSVIAAISAARHRAFARQFPEIRRMLAGVHFFSIKRAVGFQIRNPRRSRFKRIAHFTRSGLSNNEPMPILKPSFVNTRASSALPEKRKTAAFGQSLSV